MGLFESRYKSIARLEIEYDLDNLEKSKVINSKAYLESIMIRV